jgi:hypothetical protein
MESRQKHTIGRHHIVAIGAVDANVLIVAMIAQVARSHALVELMKQTKHTRVEYQTNQPTFGKFSN